MISKEEKLETFVPALALEHHMNEEYAGKKEKVRNAIRRLVSFGDYFVEEVPPDPPPFVIVDDMKFIPDALGYHVFATIRGDKPGEK